MSHRYLKYNILVVFIVILFGLLSNLFLDYSYYIRRLTGIIFYILELLFVLYLMKKQKLTLKDIGLHLPKKAKSWIISILICILPTILMIALNGGNLNMMFPAKTSLLICITQTLYYFIIIGPIEEIIYRGYIFENFLSELSETKSILYTSLLFSFIHIFNGSLMNVLMAFVISVIYCKVKVLKMNGSLLPGILGHAITDSLNQWIPYFML